MWFIAKIYQRDCQTGKRNVCHISRNTRVTQMARGIRRFGNGWTLDADV